ncbi:iron chelate uptake ABC transporter family permease subunit, partial [Streptomyces sp. NPDC055721]
MSADPVARRPGAEDLLPPGRSAAAEPVTAEPVTAGSVMAGSVTAGSVTAGPVAPRPPAARSSAARAVLFLLAVGLLVGSVAAAVRIGTADVGWTDLARVLGTHLGLDVAPLPPLVDSLVWDLRLPRVLMAALVGASLAVCGAVLQAVTRN